MNDMMTDEQLDDYLRHVQSLLDDAKTIMAQIMDHRRIEPLVAEWERNHPDEILEVGMKLLVTQDAATQEFTRNLNFLDDWAIGKEIIITDRRWNSDQPSYELTADGNGTWRDHKVVWPMRQAWLNANPITEQ